MAILYYFVLLMFLALCLLLVGVVLMQESKSSGLGASFGGDAGDSLFGVSTPRVLKVFTAWLAAIFMVSCVLLSFWTSSTSRTKMIEIPKEDVSE